MFIKGAPRSASKLSIDPIKRHASNFRKCTRSNKRTVPNNRTVSCNWDRRVPGMAKKIFVIRIPDITRIPENVATTQIPIARTDYN